MRCTDVVEEFLIKNTIYIYCDDGVDSAAFNQTIKLFQDKASRYKIEAIDAVDVRTKLWQQSAVLFVMPGGADTPYAKKLSGLGNARIKAFVANGGAYLGICAGAYYASSYVEFDKNGALEVLGTRELCFFSGKCIGPVLAPYNYLNFSGSRAAQIKTTFPAIPQISLYYNGGGFFENADKALNVKVLAYYQDGKAAMVQIKYFAGVVVLSGLHFEYNPYYLDIQNIYLKTLIPPLIRDDLLRKRLVCELLQILNLN